MTAPLPLPPHRSPPVSRSTAILCMLGVVVVWGANLSLMKAAIGEVPPLAFNAMRFPLGALALAAYIFRFDPEPWPRREEWAELVLLGIAGHALYQLCFLNGLALTSASHTSVLVASTPVWVALGDRFFGHQRLSFLAWLGIVLSIAGVVILVQARGSGGPSSPVGDFLVLFSSCLWTFYVIRSRPLLGHRSPIWVTGWALFLGAPLVVLMGVPAVLRIQWSRVTGVFWIALVFAGLFALATAYTWWAIALQRLGAARTAVFSNLIPVVALAVAWIWLGERLSVVSWMGVLVISAGVWLTTQSRKR